MSRNSHVMKWHGEGGREIERTPHHHEIIHPSALPEQTHNSALLPVLRRDCNYFRGSDIVVFSQNLVCDTQSTSLKKGGKLHSTWGALARDFERRIGRRVKAPRGEGEHDAGLVRVSAKEHDT